MKRIILGSIAIAFGLIGCTEKSSLPDRYTPIGSDAANVKFLQMSPDAPPVNFFVNGVKSTSGAPTSTNAVTGGSFPSVYPGTVGYAVIPGGPLKIDLKVPDSSSVMPGATVLSEDRTLDPKKFYTYVVVDLLSRISTVLVEDDPAVPDPLVSYFRCANFVPNSPVKIEFVKTSTGVGAVSKTYNNVAFKNISPFDTLTAGAIYKVYLKHPTTDARLDSISAFTPVATKKYTIYARGVMGLPVSDAKRPIITSYVNF